MALRVLVVSLFLAFAWITPSLAQAGIKHPIDIPSQPLGSALAELAKQARIQVVYPTDLVDGKAAHALSGSMTPEEALNALLAKTGLRFQFVDPETVTLSRDEGSAEPVGRGQAHSTSDRPAKVDAKEDGKQSSQDFRVAQVDQGASGSQVVDQAISQMKEKDDELAEVVVTGTHIRGITNTTDPVIVIDRDQIDRSGYSTTQELFRSLPQNFASGDATEDGAFSNNPRVGGNIEIASGVNLRGLGVSSTLVLLNGHRLAPSAFGSVVDISLIPLAAIDRLEILTDGSSAVYGSDAVGGVVNIILKSDYKGASTTLRYGDVTSGSRSEVDTSQTLGTSWSTGNIVGTIQIQKESALSARDRDFSSNLTLPNDLLPDTRNYGGTLSGRQDLTDELQLYGDVLLSRRTFSRGTSYSEGDASQESSRLEGSTTNVNVAPGLRYAISSNWSVDLSGLYGRIKSDPITQTTDPLYGDDVIADNSEFTEESTDLVLSGKIPAFDGRSIGVALGASYRREDAKISEADALYGSSFPRETRHVTAEFAEVFVPIVGPGNAMPLVEALDLSASVRRDDYSDFGSTTNPRVGLRWAPSSEISVRASYGKSFRAPNASEEALEGQSYIYTTTFASPTGNGTVDALELAGSTKLQPEKAQVEDIGVEYRPLGLPGLSLQLGYYDILYRNRIIFPPYTFNALQEPGVYGQLIKPIPGEAAAQAIVDAAQAAGAQYNDYVGNGLAGVAYLYDGRQQNASTVRQSGIDLTTKMTRTVGENVLSAQINATFTDRIDTALAQGGSVINLVNTFGNPPRWRGRLDLSCANARWSINGAVNGVGSYVNNGALGNPSIASWVTVDLNAQVNLDAYLQSQAWSGVTVSVSVLNALDRDPPYVDTPLPLLVNYDATNANPLGRFVAIELRKKWR
jgi:iron complex outermembrane recepter protein